MQTQPDEMVERVARLISPREWRKYDLCVAHGSQAQTDLAGQRTEASIAKARAVIAAIREDSGA
jgi:hypothetical protein